MWITKKEYKRLKNEVGMLKIECKYKQIAINGMLRRLHNRKVESWKKDERHEREDE